MTKDLEAKYRDLEAKAQEIMAERDEAMSKVRARYDDRLRKATDQAAEAQKRWLDGQVRESLKDRPDGEALAASLGVSLDED